MCIKLFKQTCEVSATLPGTMGCPCPRWEMQGGERRWGQAHISSADCSTALLQPPLPPTHSQGGIPPCVISKGHGQRQPGIWCLQFFSDKWHVSTERGGDGKAVVSNHSPLPAPSGRIILLYADELITVSSIWLLYKKKCQLLSLCQQPPEGPPLYNARVLLFKDKLLAEHQCCLRSLITALPMGPNEPALLPRGFCLVIIFN